MSTQIPAAPSPRYGMGPTPAHPSQPRQRRWPLIAVAIAASLGVIGVLLIVGLRLIATSVAGQPTPAPGVSTAPDQPMEEPHTRAADLPDLPEELMGYTASQRQYYSVNESNVGEGVDAVVVTYTRSRDLTAGDQFKVMVANGPIKRTMSDNTQRIPDRTKRCLSSEANEVLCVYFSQIRSIQVLQSETQSIQMASKILDQVYDL